METCNVGVIGCGNISDRYFANAKRFDAIKITACADLLKARAAAKAKEHEIPKPCTVKQLLADKSIDIVINLTVPKAHAEITVAALKAGKHVYTEKPLALTREEGQDILALAKKKELRVGGAPDTVLGGGIQTARKLIDDGWIGKPLAASAFMQCHGHENWHPDPEFYYELGGGPMFDMGPYYLSALITLLGPVKRVCASAKASFNARVITSAKKYGTRIPVETPTHITGIMDFRDGATATITTSFDVWGSDAPCLEIHGETGSLSLPDPNTFGGPVKIRRNGAEGFSTIPLSHGYTEENRGLGVADMACAIQSGRPHRANGRLAYHVLDMMHAFLEASEKGQYVKLKSGCERPAAMPMDLVPGQLDD